jgi:hypothetical protein
VRTSEKGTKLSKISVGFELLIKASESSVAKLI